MGELPPHYGKDTVRPLFGTNLIPAQPLQPNPGLVFDRYLAIWKSKEKLCQNRGKLLADFASDYRTLGRRPLAARAPQEVADRLERAYPEAQVRKVTTEQRFVTGLGAAHPLENGFTFDYTTGLPYLPGSSIKGLARQVAHYELDPELVGRLFGASDEEETEDGFESTARAGDIIFLPAYPEAWPELQVDIINCHHMKYYGSDGVPVGHRNVQPVETESPVPVFFLTVAPGTVFILRCLSRSGCDEYAKLALKQVTQGLSELGIGAKTALGYGVMSALEG